MRSSFDQNLCGINKPAFDIYNIFLQFEESLVYLLQECTLNLYDALLARFMKHNAVTQSDDIPSIDTEGSTNYRTKLKF